MLNENQKALISAAVDGEMSAAETQRFRKLLDSSPEALSLYSRLKNDSDRLRTLTAALPPGNLHLRVMARIAAVTPRSAPRQPQSGGLVAIPYTPSQPPRRSWVPSAIAASIILTLMGASFWFLTRDSGKAQAIARNPSVPPPATKRGAEDPDWARWLPSESGPRPVAPTLTPSPAEPETASPAPEVVPVPAPRTEVTTIAPQPRTSFNPGVMGSGFRPEIGHLDSVQVRVPLFRALADFERDDVQSDLATELGRDPAFRIDLFTRNLPRSIEWFRSAAKAAGVNVFADSATLELVNKGQVNSFVVYTESLTPAELADLFGRLANEDKKISPRIFDVVHATPIVQSDQEAIRSILGIDPGLFKRPTQEKQEKEKPHDNAKPISAGTADQIVKSLTTGKGEKSAMLSTWLPAVARTPPQASQELGQFLRKRGERKATAVPVIIVIRQRVG